MSLAILENRDVQTANSILGAAALIMAPHIAGDEPEIVKNYRSEAREAILEVRRSLKITADDISPAAISSISSFLAKSIQEKILRDVDTGELLARAGRAGRLAPSLYAVEQPKAFLQLFETLSIKRSHVEDAVKRPDDYQHLMTDRVSEEVKDAISLFVKDIRSSRAGNDHFLLIQTHRVRQTQVVQSAWRVFPGDVDLSSAVEPLDLLKAFVDVYGSVVKVGEVSGKFIENILHPKGESFTFEPGIERKEIFASVSHVDTRDPKLVEIGIAYGIDIPKYRAALSNRGLVSK